jgi:hypothetical protein
VRAKKKRGRRLGVQFKFNGDVVEPTATLSLADVRYANLREYAFMAFSKDPELQAIGENRLREFAERLAAAESAAVIGRSNIDGDIKAENEKRAIDADEAARRIFNDWRGARSRRVVVSSLTLEGQLQKFIAVGKPERPLRERLNRLLKKGRLEK